jgi:hypothetical protein
MRTEPATHVAAGVLARVVTTVAPFTAMCREVYPALLNHPHVQGRFARLAVFAEIEWRLLENGRLIALRPSSDRPHESASPEIWYQMKTAEVINMLVQRVWFDNGISLHGDGIAFLAGLNVEPIGPLASHAA